mmetsp:Transcript_74771/g.167538  ORF Transcript_74771/g.167538 Transcript_74771/m.167538 type:complete len:86 (+) Transcript_74771:1-258(+)
MRSMELKDLPGRMVMMKDLAQVMGQFPYKNPTVFNFYLPDYAPDAFPPGMVSPEFQIFDTPLVIGLAEGLLAMAKERGLSRCCNR